MMTVRRIWSVPTVQITAVFVALAAFVGCGDDDAEPDPVATWTEAFDTSTAGSLSGVWGSGPDDVFIVGGSENGGEIHHFDGSTWAPMSLPDGVPLLVWVYGFGPSDVYAVGIEGAVVHYDGAVWTALDSGVEQDLWGVFGFTADEVWIVGGDVRDGEPVLMRFDGETFEPTVIGAEENPREASALFKVWGIDGQLFAVGQSGWVLEYDGGAWARRAGGAEANQDFISLWGTAADNIVVVGGRGNGRVAEWDGSELATLAPPGLGGINAVFMNEPGVAHIGGSFGYVGTYDLATDEVTAEDAPPGADAVHAIWGDGQGRHYAVGGSFLPPHRGMAWTRTVE